MRSGTTRRAYAFVALTLVLLSGCARSGEEAPEPTSAKYGSGVDADALDQRKQDAATPRPARATDRSDTHARPAASQAPGGSARDIAQDKYAADTHGVARNAAHYIRGRPYTRLVLELTAAKGAEPLPAAVEYLVARLEEVIDKPRGIEVLPVKTFTPTRSTYTREDFLLLEEKHRTRYSGKTGGDIVLHYLFLNGEHHRGALGEAWRASSIVVMTEKIESISDVLTITPEAIQRSVLLHEAGHVLSLLNFGYQTPRPHYAPDNRIHSKNKESVMYYAVEHGDDLIDNFFHGPPPDTFDADDKADLEDVRTGKLRPYGI